MQPVRVSAPTLAALRYVRRYLTLYGPFAEAVGKATDSAVPEDEAEDGRGRVSLTFEVGAVDGHELARFLVDHGVTREVPELGLAWVADDGTEQPIPFPAPTPARRT